MTYLCRTFFGSHAFPFNECIIVIRWCVFATWRYQQQWWQLGDRTLGMCPIISSHRLRGSASPVLMVTGFVNGKWQFSTPHRIDVPHELWHVDAIWHLSCVPQLELCNFKNPTWRSPPFWKIEKLPYLGQSFSDFNEIWHGDAVLPSWPFGLLQIWDLKKSKMAAAGILTV